MIKTLEVSWLCISVVSLLLSVFQFFSEGWQPALWMLFITAIAATMYKVRRKQRIYFEDKNEKELYH